MKLPEPLECEKCCWLQQSAVFDTVVVKTLDTRSVEDGERLQELKHASLGAKRVDAGFSVNEKQKLICTVTFFT